MKYQNLVDTLLENILLRTQIDLVIDHRTMAPGHWAIICDFGRLWHISQGSLRLCGIKVETNFY